jgi:hypothetical protein
MKWTKSTHSHANGNCVEVQWRKSTHSNSFSNCVEVAAEWRKSTLSYANGDCPEVAGADGGVLVRDSKDPDGPVLKFTAAEWEAFMAGVKEGEFNTPWTAAA